MDKYCVGVDVGGTTVKLGLFQTNGRLIFKWEIPTRKEDSGKYILEDVSVAVREVLRERQIHLEQVVGVGLGVPGPVLPDGRVERCVNLGWHNVNPQSQLSGLLDNILVKSGNDANVAALGEMWQGGGMGFTDIIMVTLGTGVGGGVIIDEKIGTGKHGLGGEIGHIHIRDEETEKCNCGGIGCVEQIGSATGIAREARRKMEASDEPSSMRVFGDGITAKDVLDEAKKGDKMALEVVETVGRYLGMALAQLAMTVIGGGVSKAGQFLIDVITKYYNYYTPISENKAVIGLAKLGNDAGIYGAARLVLG